MNGEWAQEQLACLYVLMLVHGSVLRRGAKIAQPPLQRRGFIDRAAAAEREARIGDANAGGGDPYRGLRTLRQERLVLQRSGKRVAPMTCGLDLQKRPRGPYVGCDTAELAWNISDSCIGTAARSCWRPVLASATRSSKAPSAIPTELAPCSSGRKCGTA